MYQTEHIHQHRLHSLGLTDLFHLYLKLVIPPLFRLSDYPVSMWLLFPCHSQQPSTLYSHHMGFSIISIYCTFILQILSNPNSVLIPLLFLFNKYKQHVFCCCSQKPYFNCFHLRNCSPFSIHINLQPVAVMGFLLSYKISAGFPFTLSYAMFQRNIKFI